MKFLRNPHSDPIPKNWQKSFPDWHRNCTNALVTKLPNHWWAISCDTTAKILILSSNVVYFLSNNKYFNLYQPLTLPSVKSYLPNIPDITIVMKIEEIVRKNIVPSDTSV